MRITRAILATILAVAMLGTVFVSLAIANGNYTDQYILKPEAKEELINFVNEAKNFVLTEGKDKAFQVFNDPKGKFSRGELYINAQDINGTLLASPYRPEMIGKTASNLTDPNGVAYVRNILDTSKRGGGFTYYIRANPIHSNAQELKLVYVIRMDDGLCLSSGMYLPGSAPIFSNKSRKELVSFVEKARDFTLNHTKEEALKAFNDKNGEFVRGSQYIFAYDFNGTNLAFSYQPDMVGTSLFNLQDPNGVYFIQELLDAAKRGDEFTYAFYKDPIDNTTYKLKLRYAMKVNDEWLLGSGIIWPEA